MHTTDLATLTRRYFAEVAAVNAADGPSEDLYAAASRTLHALVGVPVRGPHDALAAIDWILSEADIDSGDGEIVIGGITVQQAVESMLRELRAYVAGQVRS